MRNHVLAILPGTTVMSAHTRLLMRLMRENRAGSRRDDDVYVWYGMAWPDKTDPPESVRSQICALPTEPHPKDPGPETHLYLTDYRNLYVAHVGAISLTPPAELNGTKKLDHLPGAFYRPRQKEWRKCDLWFKLWDVRCLVPDDVDLVDQEMRKLSEHGTGCRVSIFRGLAGTPTVVRHERGPRYFDCAFRERYAEGRHWVEYESEHTGVATIERELRDHFFGNETWSQLTPSERLFLASAEKQYRESLAEPMFDHATVLVEYAKVIEVRCVRLLRMVMEGTSGGLPRYRTAGGIEKNILYTNTFPGLSEIAMFIADKSRHHHFRQSLMNAEWFINNLPKVLTRLADVRNPAAHRDQVVDREMVTEWRAELCGIGRSGHLVELAKVEVRHPEDQSE